MLSIVQGNRPLQPAHPSFTVDLWTLMQSCWGHDPQSRPTIPKVVMEVLTLLIRNRLISRAPAIHERITPIAAIFLDHDQVEAVKHLSEDEVQTVIDVVDEVSPCVFPRSKNRLTDLIQTSPFVD